MTEAGTANRARSESTTEQASERPREDCCVDRLRQSAGDDRGDYDAMRRLNTNGAHAHVSDMSVGPPSDSTDPSARGTSADEAAIEHWTDHFRQPGSTSAGQADYRHMLKPDTRVIGVGDLTHGDRGTKPEEFRRLIKELSDQSVQPPVKHVGFEMLPTSMQGDLDRFHQNPDGMGEGGRTHRQILEAKLAASMGGPEQAQEWMRTLDAAQKAGIRAHALEPDMPSTGSRSGWGMVHRGISQLSQDGRALLRDIDSQDPARRAYARDRLMQEFREMDWPGPQGQPGFDGVSSAGIMMDSLLSMKRQGMDPSRLSTDRDTFRQQIEQWRDGFMATETKRILHGTDARMIVSAGSYHFAEGDGHATISGALRHEGYGTVTIGFGTGQPGPSDRRDFHVVRLAEGAHRAGIRGPYVSHLPSGAPFDYFVGLEDHRR